VKIEKSFARPDQIDEFEDAKKRVGSGRFYNIRRCYLVQTKEATHLVSLHFFERIAKCCIEFFKGNFFAMQSKFKGKEIKILTGSEARLSSLPGVSDVLGKSKSLKTSEGIPSSPKEIVDVSSALKEAIEKAGKDPDEKIQDLCSKAFKGDGAAVIELVLAYERKTEDEPQKAKEYEEIVVSLLSEAAKQHHAEAIELLGFRYLNGSSPAFPQDIEKAISYFRKLAESGDDRHMFFYGLACSKNPATYAEAANFLNKAFGQGNMQAKFELAALYAEGHGVEKDEKKAFEMFQQLAEEERDANAMAWLGKMCAAGRGTPRDDFKAITWFRETSGKGMSSEYSEETEKRLREYGCGYNLNVDLARLCESGRDLYKEGMLMGKEARDKLGFEYYQKAAEAGYGIGKAAVAVMTAEGRGTLQDKKKAIELLAKTGFPTIDRAKMYIEEQKKYLDLLSRKKERA
jgi:TPR repeat protein